MRIATLQSLVKGDIIYIAKGLYAGAKGEVTESYREDKGCAIKAKFGFEREDYYNSYTITKIKPRRKKDE